MIAGQILDDLRNAVPHIGHTNCRRVRLGVDELPEVLELCTQRGVRPVVQHDHQLQHRMFALCRNPVDHHVSIMPFMHHHVFTVDHRSFPTFVGFHCDHHMDGRRPRRRLLCYCICIGECQEREYRQSKKMTPLHVCLPPRQR